MLQKIFPFGPLLIMLCFCSAIFAQKPVLNRPLSVSVNVGKHYHIGKISTNDFYRIEQSGFHTQLAATYRMWKFWGLSAKFDYSVIPVNAEAIARHFLEQSNTAISASATSGPLTVSQLGLGYYYDFPVTKSIFIRVMPYAGLSLLKSPDIKAVILSTPHRFYKETPGRSVGFFYELQVKPTYSITRELRINAFLSYSGASHHLTTEMAGTLITRSYNLSYGRISAGVGVEIALPWVEMYWKY